MKAKVLTRFYDTEAKIVREKGDVFNVTPSRFNEIACKGRFVEVYVAPVKEAASENEQ